MAGVPGASDRFLIHIRMVDKVDDLRTIEVDKVDGGRHAH